MALVLHGVSLLFWDHWIISIAVGQQQPVIHDSQRQEATPPLVTSPSMAPTSGRPGGGETRPMESNMVIGCNWKSTINVFLMGKSMTIIYH